MKRSTLAALLLSIIGLQAQAPTCPRTVGAELVMNGDFSAGNTGFNSGYTYGQTSTALGQYSIGNDPNAFNLYHAKIKDHTPTSDGNMFFADLDATVGKTIYQTTVQVVAGRTYFFSVWVANITTPTVCCNTNPPTYQNTPKFRFTIEGVSVSPIIRVDSTHHDWKQHNIIWKALSTGTVSIAMQNVNIGHNGNMLALDDISFRSGCDGIVDLSALGKKSTLPKMVYSCNENFPFDLNTKLNNAKYNFNWYQGTTLLASGIQTDDIKSVLASSTYTVTATPAHGTKYYVCYDSLGDGLTCPRLDSVEFRTELNFDLGNSKRVCPPIYEVLSPSLGNLASYKFERYLGGVVSILKSGSGTVEPLTVTGPGMYRFTAIHNNATCGSFIDTIKIDTLPNVQIGTISRFCKEIDGTATLAVKTVGTNVNLIDGKVNVSWFNTREGGTALATSTSEATVSVNNSELIKTASCGSGGLYLQDNNSFDSKIPMEDPCPSSEFTPILSLAYVYGITSSVNFDLSNLKIHPRSFTPAGESNSYQISLYKNTEPLNNIANATALYTSSITTAWVSNTMFSDSKFVIIKGIEGIPAGSYYLSLKAFLTGDPQSSRELGGKPCTSTANNFQDPKGLVKITNLYHYTNPQPNVVGSIFGIDIHIGTKTPCIRQWVCSQCVVVTDQKDITLDQEVTVYPNPAESQVTIEMKSKEPYTYTLSNMYGQELFATSQKLEGSTQLDVSSYAAGTYLLTIKTSGKSSTKLLVIQ